MKISLRLAGCAVGMAALAFTGGASADQPDAFSIQLVEAFDYPGTGNQTRPQKISDKGQIAGIVVDTSGVTFAFTKRGANYSPPIINPNDLGNTTEGRGINNAGVVCGDYIDSLGAFEGFFFKSGNFTNYAPDATFTIVLGINNAGDFCGSEIPDATGVQSAFTNIGGVLEDFTIRNASATLAYMINSANQTCGYYNDAAGASHGWWRDTDGSIHAPIDPAGSTTTIIFGNNDRNIMVGRYVDGAGLTHGIVFMPPNRFIQYDFPGSSFTSLNGINRSNQIVGRYTETATGIDHGLLLQLVKTADGGVELPLAKAPMAAPRLPQHPANANPAY
jgi:hypothetical protein